jgi:RND family efflux transporter MFP subunit
MKSRKVLLPVLIVVVAVALTIALVKSRKVPKPHETPHLGPLVEVAELEQINRAVVVSATGTVQARHEVNITPQVRGTVVRVSPNMVAGGNFKQGELLFAIEDVDYQLAIDLARANLAQSELELLRNENLAKVARQEWIALNPGTTEEPDPLVVYEPQMKSARAQRDAALANVKQAEINLLRTQIFAPFSGYVRSEQVEVGQYLNVGSPVATIVGTEQAEVVVPLPLDELAWLKVPASGAGNKGSKAEIVLQSGDTLFKWQGVVTRAMGEIDPRNRMARIVVTVDEPVAQDGTSILNRLVPGMFVEVYLYGEEIHGVIALSRGALHDDDTVWVLDEANKLRIRNIQIVRRERDEVLVSAGIKAGEKIILTNLSAAAEGMVLRPQVREVGQ